MGEKLYSDTIENSGASRSRVPESAEIEEETIRRLVREVVMPQVVKLVYPESQY